MILSFGFGISHTINPPTSHLKRLILEKNRSVLIPHTLSIPAAWAGVDQLRMRNQNHRVNFNNADSHIDIISW